MTSEVSCPSCTQSVRVPESSLGKKGRCPACKHVFLLPARLPAQVESLEPIGAPLRPSAGTLPPAPDPFGSQADSLFSQLPPSLDDQWYCYLPDGTEQGPGSRQQLQTALAQGQIPPNCLVRRADWPQAAPAAAALSGQYGPTGQRDMYGAHGSYAEQLKRSPFRTLLRGPQMVDYVGDSSPQAKAARWRHFKLWLYVWGGGWAFNMLVPALFGIYQLGIAGIVIGALAGIPAYLFPSFFFAIGLFIYCAALFEWRGFFRMKQAKGARRLFGDAGARTMYLGMGLFIMLPSLCFGLLTSLSGVEQVWRGTAPFQAEWVRNQRQKENDGPPAITNSSVIDDPSLLRNLPAASGSYQPATLPGVSTDEQRFNNEVAHLRELQKQIVQEAGRLAGLKNNIAEMKKRFAGQPMPVGDSPLLQLHYQVVGAVGNVRAFSQQWEQLKGTALQSSRAAGKSLPSDCQALPAEARINDADYQESFAAATAATQQQSTQQVERGLSGAVREIETTLGDRSRFQPDDRGLKPFVEEQLARCNAARATANRLAAEERQGTYQGKALKKYRALEAGLRSLQKINSADLRSRAGRLPEWGDEYKRRPDIRQREQAYLDAARELRQHFKAHQDILQIQEQVRKMGGTTLDPPPHLAINLRTAEIYFAISKVLLEVDAAEGERSVYLDK